ncbi:MAG: hypothetical protein IPK13_27345 [Deltaproteobacteria bacterium]|nr:hypothetical protein [Deltaproteobacteria bacterium]
MTVLQPTNYPRHSPFVVDTHLVAPAGSPGLEPRSLVVAIDVRDDYVRQQVPGFDGLERVFTLIPKDEAGKTWSRRDLAFLRTVDSPAIGSHIDQHLAIIPLEPGDSTHITQHGIAFGMDTNCGTLWFQEKGHNLVPATAWRM